MKLKAMIIDDDPFVREDLNQRLRRYREIKVIGEAGTIPEAKQLLLQNKPDVVFLDIPLRGGTGFDLLPFMDPATEIIFITAYDKYAVRAFEVNALDFIMKPIRQDRLAKSITRLTSAWLATNTGSRTRYPSRYDDRILIRTKSAQMLVPPEDISLVVSIGGNYTSVHLRNGDNLVCRKTLKQWEDRLPKPLFIRTHSSTIINLDWIERVIYMPNGSARIYLRGQKPPAVVSRRKVPHLKEQIGSSI